MAGFTRPWRPLLAAGGLAMLAGGLCGSGLAAGVPAARIDTSWLGEGKQDVPTPEDVAQQRNRVVDIVLQEPS